MATTRDINHVRGPFRNLEAIASTVAAGGKGAETTSGLLLGFGLATGMEFYAYDGVNLVLPDVIRPHVGVFALISP